MRSLDLGLIIVFVFALGLGTAQETIRQVDFKNFVYPMSGTTLGHDRLVWLDTASKRRIRLVNGTGIPGKPGFTLASLKFADVTGDGKDSAIVVLHFDTGGTQQTDYVYVYSLTDGKPEPLAYFYTGDRAHSGLYGVYGEGGRLVVELLDPSKSEGDCCSTGFIRTRYQWRIDKFERVGDPEYGMVPSK
jgi:hypothetical protein